MELAALRYLVEVAEKGSFTKAAAKFGLTTSTLTRRIAQLEDELGVTLLERNRTGIRVTSGGIMVIVEVRKMLADLEAVSRAARSSGTGKLGELRLGIRIPPIGEPLRTLLGTWRSNHSEVSLSLQEMTDHDLHLAIESRRLDVALVAGYGDWSNVTAEALYHERILVAFPAEHPSLRERTISWSALRSEIVLVQEWADSHDTREFYSSLLGLGVQFSTHSASKQSILGLVGAGFGITLVMEGQAQVKFPGVVFRQIDEPDAITQVLLAWAADAEDALIGSFVAFMRDEARLRKLF